MSQEQPWFCRSAADSRLYWLLGGERRVGMLSSSSEVLADEVTLDESLADLYGCWFWLDAPPIDDAIFANTLTKVMGCRYSRAVWIANAAADGSQWRTHSLDLLVTSTKLSEETFDATGVRLTAQYRVPAAASTAADGYWQLNLSGAGSGCTLQANGSAWRGDGDLAITYDPNRSGCLLWELPLPAPKVEDPLSALEQLGVSLRYCAPDAENSGGIDCLQVTPLRQRGALRLYCALDPLAMFDPQRTRFSLLPPIGPAAVLPFGTGFITARGEAIELLPAAVGSQPPGFVLARQPITSADPNGEAQSISYLTPDGAFDLSVVAQGGSGQTSPSSSAQGPAVRVMCGTSGLEYIGLSSPTGTRLWFRAGGAAYAAATDSALSPVATALTSLGTTAWIWLTGESAPGYYAQPEEAPFYSGGQDGFLEYLELPAVALSSTQATPAFPLLGYAGLAPAAAALAQVLEVSAIAPERRRVITALTAEQAAGELLPLARDASVQVAVSPSGLAFGYHQLDSAWEWLAIGNSAGGSVPDLCFTAVTGPFRQALLSNQLFMVLGVADSVMASGSVAYRLTEANLGLVAEQGAVREPILLQVAVAAAVADYPIYPTEAAFDAMLQSATGNAIEPAEQLIFQRYAGLLAPTIGDWLFRLGPRNWSADVASDRCPTRLIFKFSSGRSLADQVADPCAWSWPGAAAANGDVGVVSREILATIQAARAAQAANPNSPYGPFLTVVDDPYWSGVLALSVEVAMDTLPESIQPLAAGIDSSRFYAHHLGFSATGFTAQEGGLYFDTSASFGLIDYQNPVDQYFSSDTAFAFRVQQLSVAFENGKLSHFASSVQLMINRLFGSQTQLFPTLHGNNLILDGSYQYERDDSGIGRDTYLFALREPGLFQLELGVLAAVAVERVRMVTARATDPASGQVTVVTTFELAGRLQFRELEAFDPFCWGASVSLEEDTMAATEGAAVILDEATSGLAFANYVVTMSFPLAQPSEVQFGVAEGAISLDAERHPARADALFSRFPLRLGGLLTTPDPLLTGETSSQTPASHGFVSISVPLQQGQLTQPWYGLVYELDLGGLGGLGGALKMTLRLLAAWSPGGAQKGAPAIYCGVALPGVAGGLGAQLPLQGILDFGFRAIQFSTYYDSAGRRQYLLRLRDFGLHALGFSLPPGHNDVLLFSQPDQGTNTQLGWYAAYDSSHSTSTSHRTD